MKQASIMLSFAVLSLTVIFLVLNISQFPGYFWINELLIFTLIAACFLVMLYVFQQDRIRLMTLTQLFPEKYKLVVDSLIQHHSLSKLSLQNMTGLSKKQISTIIKNLRSKRLIVEKGDQIYLVMDM